MEKAKKMISLLSFEECIKLYNSLNSGNKIIDLLFDRMEEIDYERFENFLG